MKRILLVTAALALLLVRCGTETENEEASTEKETKESKSAQNDGALQVEEVPHAHFSNLDSLIKESPEIDLDMPLDSFTVEDLRILRNLVPARQGYLFMHADLRTYFQNTDWYTEIMERRWYGECEYNDLDPLPEISYSEEEQAFMDRVFEREKELRKKNLISVDGVTLANMENVVNLWQYEDFDKKLFDKLEKQNVAIVPSDNVQHFHVYEENDYSQTQNFVTTDMFLQLMHMHFSFLLRNVEGQYFVKTLGTLSRDMINEADEVAQSASTEKIKNDARYAESFFAVTYELLGNTALIDDKTLLHAELQKIKAEVDGLSPMLPMYQEKNFPYSLFRPRGHYTRSDELKRYFKAMQWLQWGGLCVHDEDDMRRAFLMAHLLKQGDNLKHYKSILEPTVFLIGEPDNLSVLDLVDILNKHSVSTVDGIYDQATMQKLMADAKELAKKRNVITPKVTVGCQDIVNFMPARYIMDNEVLQEMAWVEANKATDRPYPKGLDVFAAFGSEEAEEILLDFYEEDKVWHEYKPRLEKLQKKFSKFDGWENTAYMKWVEALLAMLEEDDRYPYFMQTEAWDRKNLNAALASWAELKHDAILYAEQPFAAECGGGPACDPPPEPYTVGYVEPNVRLWKKTIEMVDLVATIFDRYDIDLGGYEHKHEKIRELAEFMLSASEKELKGEPLNEGEYRAIEHIGTTFEHITLDLMDTYDWSGVTGPDKEVAVVADVYTNNADAEKKGILHVAVGNVDYLYVVVNIEGYMYITKGSAFSYYEFPRPLDSPRLTDEDWQKMLDEGKVYPRPKWMDMLLVPLEEIPEPQTYVYSSGC